jgi:hypothetical protein
MDRSSTFPVLVMAHLHDIHSEPTHTLIIRECKSLLGIGRGEQ